MTDRLDEILSDLSTEKRLEQERQREQEQLRRAAVAAVRLGNAARAKLLARPEEPLASKTDADKMYRRVRAAREMKALSDKGRWSDERANQEAF